MGVGSGAAPCDSRWREMQCPQGRKWRGRSRAPAGGRGHRRTAHHDTRTRADAGAHDRDVDGDDDAERDGAGNTLAGRVRLHQVMGVGAGGAIAGRTTGCSGRRGRVGAGSAMVGRVRVLRATGEGQQAPWSVACGCSRRRARRSTWPTCEEQLAVQTARVHDQRRSGAHRRRSTGGRLDELVRGRADGSVRGHICP
ncbi:hypothetical protein D1007_17045 [Hordeum vulgare]|nr:hypothetical protein D1007_17045 [Hordeum vulgare]